MKDALISRAEIQAAAQRIAPHVMRTPLRYSPSLSRATGGEVFLKIETLQPTFSYKIRGATNAVLSLVEAHGRGVPPIVTASAGNHGRAMAHAASVAGLQLTVYIAEGAPRTKVDAIRGLGAALRPCADYDEAERRAKAHAADGTAVYISPYAHPHVIAGAGTIALEILEEDPRIDAIVASIGGGGLISGLAIATAGRVDIFGAEIEASTPFTQSLAAGRIVEIEVGETIADGLSGNLDPDSPTFEIVRKSVTGVVVVTEEAARKGIRSALADEKLVLEGAAAVAYAAAQSGRMDLRGRRTAVVISGANIDLDKLKALL